MLHKPFYDPLRSYEDNYDFGPYGAFADKKIYKQNGKPTYNFLGFKVHLPFGIAAGPLVNSKFVKATFEKGFDLVVYKTVRSAFFPSHPFPNVLAVKIKGDLTLKKAKGRLVADNKYGEPLSITNSFGVPSKEPTIWQKDAKKALKSTGKGQVMILSFMGTVRPNQTQEEFVKDFALAAKLASQTKAKILEANLSCPNIGNEGLVCYNLDVTEKVCKAVRKVIGKTPLILKVGYYASTKDLNRLAGIAHKYAQAVAVINTIPTEIVDKKGNQALPGKMRLKSGVCGHAIKWAGLDMVKKLKKIKDKNKYSFSIVGVGGVLNPKDYFDYMKAGADAVITATGGMWNPYLAQEIKKK